MKDKKIVLLIDAENTSARYADGIVQYLEKRGDIICARIYGDFINNVNVKGWNAKAIQYEMEQKQQLTTTAGKNSSDIALVIDAMDLLYQKKIDTLCIVTSDGDFTGLVKRIREDGIEVIGIGKADASKRLEKVCDQYFDFEDIAGVSTYEKVRRQNVIRVNRKVMAKPEQKKNDYRQSENKKIDNWKNEKVRKTKTAQREEKYKRIEPLKNIVTTIQELVQQDDKAGKHSALGGVKSRLQLKYPGFAEKDYGYNSIREFIEQETNLVIYQEGRHAYVGLIKKQAKKAEVAEEAEETSELESVCWYILDEFPNKVIGIHEMGALGRKLHKRFEHFDYKSFVDKKLVV